MLVGCGSSGDGADTHGTNSSGDEAQSPNDTGCEVDAGLVIGGDVVLNQRVFADFAIDGELRKAFVPYDIRDAGGGVSVVDLDRLEIVGDIPFDPALAGSVEIDVNSHLLYAAGAESSIAVFDTTTEQQIRTIPTLDAVRDLALDADRKTLYVAHDAVDQIEVINVDTGQSIATIQLPLDPNIVAVDEVNQTVYVATVGGEHGGKVAIIDGSQERARSDSGCRWQRRRLDGRLNKSSGFHLEQLLRGRVSN